MGGQTRPDASFDGTVVTSSSSFSWNLLSCKSSTVGMAGFRDRQRQIAHSAGVLRSCALCRGMSGGEAENRFCMDEYRRSTAEKENRA